MFTYEEFIDNNLSEFPSLFSHPDRQQAELKILDQLLNVNGSGIRDDEELVDYLTPKPPREKHE